MQSLFAVLISMAVLLLSWSGHQQNGRTTDCRQINTAFEPGEVLVYRVAYHWNALWLNAGEVSFTVNNSVYGDRQVYHIIGYGATYKTYDWFFKVRDTYETFVDQETLLPLKFIRNVYEGGYTIYENVSFNHAEGKAISLKREQQIPPCTHDVLSAIYFARNIDFNKYQINDTIPIKLFLDDSLYHVYIRYLGKELIKSRKGTFNCIKFRPLLIKGTIFKGGEQMVVWVTDDENKIPIIVESPIIVGSIRAELHRWQGLRHPLRSKIS
ncbi:MAG: DUF3108 domain-containing protein [Chitinophagales bacterium]|nr:DUF3108 domain-containing protein [Chitinophagales bacterium]MDW8428008.1 DUF3108 domain-containing protein [Chitinophagales bacterium]